ncbi:hypothetical protein RFI_40267, partial [Reticulomyxa filosa]
MRWIKQDILIEKQEKEQKLNIINQDYIFDNMLLKGFKDLNDKLQKLIEEDQRWIENEWNELGKKWSKWNSQEIAIFIGHILKCEKSKLNQFYDIIKKKKIDGMSLLKMSKNDLMTILNFEIFSN